MTSRAKAWTLLEGGCACGQLRYRLLQPPLFVHCCHCRRCQRESGTAFVTHAMIERDYVEIQSGELTFSRLPTDSKRRHEIAHCVTCLTAIWGQHGRQPSRLLYLKVGTLDEPALMPTQAHIFVRSKLSWVTLDQRVPAYAGYYEAASTWPAESLARYRAGQPKRC